MLEINTHTVSREEYSWAMYAARDHVLSAHSTAGISPVRWTEETALGMPCEMVAEEAIRLLRQYYGEAALAQDRGYLDDGSFEALRSELEEENRQRSDALAAGEVFTGLTAYDLQQYITYRSDALRREFCSDDSNPEMQVSQEAVLQRYELDKDALFSMEDSLELHYLTLDIHGMEADAVDALAKDLELLRQQALAGCSLRDAVRQNPDLADFYWELQMEGSNYAAYARGYGDILTLASQLQSGEVSQVIRQESRMYLIQCVSRTDNDYYPLEDVYAIVLQSVRQDRYDALVEAYMNKTQVVYDPDALIRYTARELE